MNFIPPVFGTGNKRYHTYHQYLHSRFGQKVSRISLNAGFTCPNLDGSKGTGGCVYCSASGSGEFGGDPARSITQQFADGVRLMGEKWKTDLHIAYLQARTNTYAPLARLREVYREALACPGVVGLAVATRPDCLPEDVCTLLEEISHETYLTVELGLQTMHNKTGRVLNRGHGLQEFVDGCEKLRARGILFGVHLINGLPDETPEMMRESARLVAQLAPHLVKLHQMQVLAGTPLAQHWRQGEIPMLSQEEYVAVVCDQLELLPPATVIGRVTGDGAADDLLAPEWSRRKRCVLNEIDKELLRRGSWQGKLFRLRGTVDPAI